MGRMKFIIIFFVAVFLALNQPALAQPKSTASGLKIGQSVHELLRSHGAPDKKIPRRQLNAEIWSYGESLIFVTSGRVTGWTDSGELMERAQQNEREHEARTGDSFVHSGWKNEWSRYERVDERAVIDSLVTNSGS